MTAFYIPNPLKLRTMQDAINMFLACIAIPYIYILVEFLVVRPVPWHTWLNFIKFHYGIVACNLWAHETYFVVLYSLMIAIQGPDHMLAKAIRSAATNRLMIFVVPFVSNCLYSGDCHFLADSVATNASRLWFKDNVVVYITVVSIAVIEGTRYGFKRSTIGLWVFGITAFGPETMLPLLLMNLLNLELTVPAAERRSKTFDKAHLWYLGLAAASVASWYAEVFEFVAVGGELWVDMEATIQQVGGATMTPSSALHFFAIFAMFPPLLVYALPLWPVPKVHTKGNSDKLCGSALFETFRAWVLRYRFTILAFSSIATAIQLLFFFREFETNRTYYSLPGDTTRPEVEFDDAGAGAAANGIVDGVANGHGNGTPASGRRSTKKQQRSSARRRVTRASRARSSSPVRRAVKDDDSSDDDTVHHNEEQDRILGTWMLLGLVVATIILMVLLLKVEAAVPVMVLAYSIVINDRHNPILPIIEPLNAMYRTYPRLAPWLVWLLPVALMSTRTFTMATYVKAIFSVVFGELTFAMAVGHFKAWSLRLTSVLVATFVLSLSVLINALNNDQGPGRPPAKHGSTSPKKLRVRAALLIGVVALAFAYTGHPCELKPGQENLGDMGQYDYLRTLMAGQTSNGMARRGQHGKVHGCIRGEFQAYPNMPSRFRHGVFKPGSSFPVWLRASSGSIAERPDNVPDMRGMAVKLTGVPGPKVLGANATEHNTQDFLFVSSETFFTDDVTSYGPLFAALTAPNPKVALLKYAFGSLNPLNWNVKTLYRLLRNGLQGLKVKNPLTHEFYSTTAYRLGDTTQAVRYRLRPCPGTQDSLTRRNHDVKHAAAAPETYLRDNMAATLQADACLELQVLEQGQDACKNPVDKPTSKWGGKWTTVGTLVFPEQEFRYRSQMDFCRALSFSPWHALPEHKPLGAVNFARRVAYEGSAAARRAVNGDSTTEPTGREQFSGPLAAYGATDGDYTAKGNVKDYDFEKYPPPFQHLPPHVKALPKQEEFSSSKKFWLGITGQRLNFHYLKEYVGLTSYNEDESGKTFKERFTHVDDYLAMFDDHGYLEPTAISKCWESDQVWVDQFTAGINPTMITLSSAVKQPPHATRLSEEQVDAIDAYLQPWNTTLAGLHSSDRLFFADYSELAAIEPKAGAVIYAGFVLLFTDADAADALKPLTIFLDDNNVFTPDAPALEWKYAKMHAAHSDGLIHELNTHLVRTHLALEPVIVAAHRQLSEDHPLLQLLKPHFHDTLAINEFGRVTLLASDIKFSLIDKTFSTGLLGALQLMANDYRDNFRLDELALPKQLAKRGFKAVKQGRRDVLPGYAYRDAGLMYWSALKKYIDAAVRSVYLSNDQVTDDEELMAMLYELGDPDRGAMPGMPTVRTRAALVELLTSVVFTATAQHSSVNYGQEEFYAMVPNRPLLMHAAMPVNRSLLSEEYIAKSLPDRMESLLWVVTASILSIDGNPDVFIPVNERPTPESYGYPHAFPSVHAKDWLFMEQYNAFVLDLDEVDAKMQAYNAKWFASKNKCFDYPWMYPGRMARSISI